MSDRAKRLRERLLTAAEGYLELDMPGHALAQLTQIPDPEREAFEIDRLRGEIHRHQGEHAQALVAFERAAQVHGEDIQLLMAMAWCFKRTAQLPRAIQAMEKAYRLRPKEAVILYNLACYWCLAGDKGQTLSWLGRALRMDKSLRDLIPMESDFDSLRHDADFALVTGIEPSGA